LAYECVTVENILSERNALYANALPAELKEVFPNSVSRGGYESIKSSHSFRLAGVVMNLLRVLTALGSGVYHYRYYSLWNPVIWCR
jgi:hypothetical protein